MTKKSPHPLIWALIRRRYELGLTQQRVALKLGMGPSQLAMYESGAVSPTLVPLTRIADALGCDVVLVPRESTQETT